jgi:hypothetical protein
VPYLDELPFAPWQDHRLGELAARRLVTRAQGGLFCLNIESDDEEEQRQQEKDKGVKAYLVQLPHGSSPSQMEGFDNKVSDSFFSP